MDATTVQPTLLSAAKNFIRKSAGTAVVIIAPLAAISVANQAKGQMIFTPPGSMDASGLGYPGVFGSGGYFHSQLSALGGIAGFRQGVNANFIFTGPESGTEYISLPNVSFSGGTIFSGTTIPVTYSFTFVGSGAATMSVWTLYSEVAPDPMQPVASGSGFGTFSGTANYIQVNDATNTNAVFQLAFGYTATNNGDAIYVIMNPGSQGISFNATAIPEPSTYGWMFGWGALGLAIARRWRRTIIA